MNKIACKVFKLALTIGAAVLVIISIAIGFFNYWLITHDSPKLLRGLVYLLNPPDEIFEKISVLTKYSVENRSMAASITYENIYYGGYDILIVFEKTKSISYAKYSKLDVDYSVACVSESGIQFHDSGNSASWGYSLSYYSVPEDFPHGEKIECNVTVTGVPEDFLGKYGPTYISIRKLADI